MCLGPIITRPVIEARSRHNFPIHDGITDIN